MGAINCSDSELSTYLQALGEGYLPTSSWATYPSAPWRVISIAPVSYQRGSRTVSFRGFPSLKMLKLSMAVHGEASSTSSRAASPAKTSAGPEPALASQVPRAAFGMKWRALCLRYCRATSSWKTFPRSFDAASLKSLGRFPPWGTMLGGACWELMTLAPPTKGKGSGLLPTPTTARNMLSPCMHRWAAHRRLATPTATDARANGPASQLRRRSPPLNAQAGGSLNPQWVEWLMGWPIGWSGCAPLAMAKFLQWLRQLGV